VPIRPPSGPGSGACSSCRSWFAPAAAPVVGGLLADHLSWCWIFGLNLPFGAVGLLLGALYLVEYRKERPGRFDVAGFLLSGVGLCLILYAISEGDQPRRRHNGLGSASCGPGVLPQHRLQAEPAAFSQVLAFAHPDEGDPAPDRRQIRGEQALDEDRGSGVGLGDTGRGEAEDHARFHHAHAAR
jgi:hypothetical protein